MQEAPPTFCVQCVFGFVLRGGQPAVSSRVLWTWAVPLAPLLSCVRVMGTHVTAAFAISTSAPAQQAREHRRRWGTPPCSGPRGQRKQLGLQRVGWGLGAGTLQMPRCHLMEIQLPQPAVVRAASHLSMGVWGREGLALPCMSGHKALAQGTEVTCLTGEGPWVPVETEARTSRGM